MSKPRGGLDDLRKNKYASAVEWGNVIVVMWPEQVDNED